MDAERFDAVTRLLAAGASRRPVLRGLSAVALGLAAVDLLDVASAKKGKKPRKNAFGCLNVGKACRGKNGKCCSGICQGKKPKKGKNDKSSCAAHNEGGCTPERSVCVTGSPISLCPSGNSGGTCITTTGNAGYCARNDDFSLAVNCRVCQTDADCEAQGFPPASACVILSGGFCAADLDCTGVNGSSGTACVAPGA